MSFYADLIQAKNALDSNDISYQDFLHYTDPSNPQGIYAPAIAGLQSIMNLKEFDDASKETQKAVRDQMNLLLGYTDIQSASVDVAQFRQLFEGLGLEPKAMRQDRLQLKTNPQAIPVLDFSDDGLPNWSVRSSLELTPDAIKSNNLFRTTIYNDDGIPQQIIVAGFQANKDDPNATAPVYKAAIPGIGVVRMEKATDGTPTIFNESTGRNESIASKTNQYTQQIEYSMTASMNPVAYNDAQTKIGQYKKIYADLLGGATPSNEWLYKKVRTQATPDSVTQEILSSDTYLQRQALLVNREPAQPQGQLMSPVVAPTGVPQPPPGPMSREQPIGRGGPGSVPNASRIMPGPAMPGPTGIPSLSTVRGFFRQMRP